MLLALTLRRVALQHQGDAGMRVTRHEVELRLQALLAGAFRRVVLQPCMRLVMTLDAAGGAAVPVAARREDAMCGAAAAGDAGIRAVAGGAAACGALAAGE